METNRMKRISLCSAVSTLLAVAVAAPAFAQGGPPPGPGGFGGPMMRPAAIGTVRSVSPSDHTIRFVNGRGETCDLHVTSDTKIVGVKTIPASDLKVGDRVQIRGRVMEISADSIFAGGDLGAMPPMGPPPGAPGMGGFGPRSGAGGPGFGPGRMPFAGGAAIEQGTVSQVSPLKISFGGGRTVTVNTTDSTKVRAVRDESLSDLKSGDRIIIQGRPGSDGSLTASRISVNFPMPPPPGQFGMAGRGRGGPGPQGFGGPGGPGFGPGGAGPGFGGGGYGPPPGGGQGQQGFGPPPAGGQGPQGFGPPPGDGQGPGMPPPDDQSAAPGMPGGAGPGDDTAGS